MVIGDSEMVFRDGVWVDVRDAQDSVRRLRDKNRKAKQRKKKKEKDSRKAAEASRAPYVESIWSRRGRLHGRASLFLKITSNEETTLAVATSIWRWDRATGWNQIDIPDDEETRPFKPDLSTKKGRSAYNHANYNKRKSAVKVDGETTAKRPYTRTSFPKRKRLDLMVDDSTLPSTSNPATTTELDSTEADV
jgi:hypothetical protein